MASAGVSGRSTPGDWITASSGIASTVFSPVMRSNSARTTSSDPGAIANCDALADGAVRASGACGVASAGVAASVPVATVALMSMNRRARPLRRAAPAADLSGHGASRLGLLDAIESGAGQRNGGFGLRRARHGASAALARRPSQARPRRSASAMPVQTSTTDAGRRNPGDRLPGQAQHLAGVGEAHHAAQLAGRGLRCKGRRSSPPRRRDRASASSAAAAGRHHRDRWQTPRARAPTREAAR